jgi:hypothetical protein
VTTYTEYVRSRTGYADLNEDEKRKYEGYEEMVTFSNTVLSHRRCRMDPYDERKSL